jgi:hypothetical protein
VGAEATEERELAEEMAGGAALDAMDDAASETEEIEEREEEEEESGAPALEELDSGALLLEESEGIELVEELAEEVTCAVQRRRSISGFSIRTRTSTPRRTAVGRNCRRGDALESMQQRKAVGFSTLPPPPHPGEASRSTCGHDRNSGGTGLAGEGTRSGE